MVSSRITALLLAAVALSSVAIAKPFAPDLYDRAELSESSRMGKRQSFGSQPFAPDLFSRSEVEEIAQAKRAPAPSVDSTSWSPMEFLGLRAFSEEELHARGKVDDSIIEKRGSCSKDNQCEAKQYCSTRKFRCYTKLETGHHCTRDGACATGYCCESNSKCQVKRSVGDRCHSNNGACWSGYCSVRSDMCRDQAGHGGRCIVDDGCEGDLTCVNQSCRKSSSGTSPVHHNPHRPSPSGSAQNKRTLRHV